MRRNYFGGNDITNYLQTLLKKKGYNLSNNLEDTCILNEIKEKFGFVSNDFEKEMEISNNNSDLNKVYKLPDGNEINIDKERFECTEVLFQPSLIGSEVNGIHEMIYNCVMKLDVDIRRDTYNNIVLSGGTTLFPGFAQRIEKEITQLNANYYEVKVIAEPERKYLSWIGASITTSLSSFENQWIPIEEYDEYGPSIVHKKCF